LRASPLGADAGYPYQARTIKRLARARGQLLGISARLGGAGVIDPVDRKQLKNGRCRAGKPTKRRTASWSVLFSAPPRGVQTARITERLGNPAAQQLTSLIAVHAYGIPDVFPGRRSPKPRPPRSLTSSAGEDLRHLP
jgi:ribonuclease R